MRGFLASGLALLALLATAAATSAGKEKQTSQEITEKPGDGGNGSGVPGGLIGKEECKNATEEVWHLPYPGDCTKFIKCDILRDLSTIYTCDDPLHFNATIQTCDWPENAGCEGGESGKVKDDEISVDSVDVDNVDDESSGDEGKGTGELDNSVGVEECKKATEDVWHLTYPGDCTKFIKCDILGGLSVIYSCPDPLHFNATIQTCDWPENAGCDSVVTVPVTEEGTSTATSGGVTEPTDGSGETSTESVTEPADGSGETGTEIVTEPTDGSGETSTESVTDPESGECEVDELSESNSSFEKEDIPNELCNGATKDHYHFSHPTDPTLFYKCELTTGVAVLLQCTDGLVWNNEDQTCAYPTKGVPNLPSIP